MVESSLSLVSEDEQEEDEIHQGSEASLDESTFFCNASAGRLLVDGMCDHTSGPQLPVLSCPLAPFCAASPFTGVDAASVAEAGPPGVEVATGRGLSEDISASKAFVSASLSKAFDGMCCAEAGAPGVEISVGALP